MKFKKFMDGIKDLEHIAKEFMTDVAVQVTNDAHGNHRATFMMEVPYTSKTREFTVMVSPGPIDELFIELDAQKDTFFNANIAGFYKFMWHAAESDLGKVVKAIETLTDPYE